MRVLYLEDDAADVELAQRYLDGHAPQLRLTHADTLAAARELLAGEGAWDLVLADYDLPDGNGLDLVAELQQADQPPPVVILTARADGEMALAALRAGATDYLVKRGDYLQRLPEALTNALERWRRESQRRTRPIRVLYAETDAAEAERARAHFARYAPHLRLDVVGDGAAVLASLPDSGLQADRPAAPDILLLDVRLAGADALDLLATVRNERRLDLPVVLITGPDDGELVAQAFRLGASQFLIRHAGHLMALPSVLESAYDRVQLARERASLAMIEAAVRHAHDAVIITTAEPLESPGPFITFANDATCRITGYSREELIGRSPRMFQGTQTDPATSARIGHALRAGEPVTAEVCNHRKDGSTYWVDLSIAPLKEATGRIVCFISIQQDATKRRQIEAEKAIMQKSMVESQKLEVLGTLSGGIAHNFNNMLAGIMGCNDLARQDLPEDSPVLEHLNLIDLAAQRGAQLCRQMLAYTGRHPMQVERFELNLLLHNNSMLLDVSTGPRVRVVLELGERLPEIDGDLEQLNQVVLNLVLNAAEALGDGAGRITVRTGVAAVDQAALNRAVTTPGMLPGDYAFLEVADNGPGITPEVMERLFNPFFSTKSLGRGLGLFAVLGIVRAHHGAVQVQSEPGQGATFRVLLPVKKTGAGAAG